MHTISFILLLLLIMATALSVFKKGRAAFGARAFRISAVVFGLAFFAWWFVERSVTKFYKDALAVQIINKLPQAVDFYVIQVNSAGAPERFATSHIGKIRPEHYRLDYLQMHHSKEIWVSGYIGKRQVYFSQHAVPSKNYDQIIEVNNYINQSVRLSSTADTEIHSLLSGQLIDGIWITLGMLLLFLNIILLLRMVSPAKTV